MLQKRRFGFNGLDFLTMYLYQNNPRLLGQRPTICDLSDIPWVAREWAAKPRPPLPLSLQWSDEQAATKLQAYWRGYLVSGRGVGYPWSIFID